MDQIKQEIINHIAKYVCNICEMGGDFDGECHDIGAYDYRTCKSCQETASKIYNDIFISFKNSAQNQNGGLKE